jgi:hypothetical protein
MAVYYSRDLEGLKSATLGASQFHFRHLKTQLCCGCPSEHRQNVERSDQEERVL